MKKFTKKFIKNYLQSKQVKTLDITLYSENNQALVVGKDKYGLYKIYQCFISDGAPKITLGSDTCMLETYWDCNETMREVK